MQPYTGINTSLYATLSAESTIHLEHASLLTDHGRVEEAQQIYDGALLAQRLHPAVVLGRADLTLKQFKMGALFRITDEALRDASMQGSELNMPEFRLMALMRAFAAYSHRGVCGPALTEISRAQSWLKDVPVTEYTDIQVRILSFATVWL